MGSGFRNSRVSIEVKMTSYTLTHNAKQDFLIKKQIKDGKEISEPNNKHYMNRRAKKCKLTFITLAW